MEKLRKDSRTSQCSKRARKGRRKIWLKKLQRRILAPIGQINIPQRMNIQKWRTTVCVLEIGLKSVHAWMILDYHWWIYPVWYYVRACSPIFSEKVYLLYRFQKKTPKKSFFTTTITDQGGIGMMKIDINADGIYTVLMVKNMLPMQHYTYIFQISTDCLHAFTFWD